MEEEVKADGNFLCPQNLSFFLNIKSVFPSNDAHILVKHGMRVGKYPIGGNAISTFPLDFYLIKHHSFLINVYG